MLVCLLKWMVYFSEPEVLGQLGCQEFAEQRICECFLWSRCGYTYERVTVQDVI